MSFTIELLDAAKKAQGIESDYRLAQLLMTTPNVVSNYRRGVSFPSNSMAWKLGELAGDDPASAVVGCNMDRANNPEDRRIWRALGESIQAVDRLKPCA